MTALEKFGSETQLKKAVEELNELIEAIERGDKEAITDEIADVEIMIGQVVEIIGINRRNVENRKRYKNNRTINRIRCGYYDGIKGGIE